jgi:hypothetical protein
MSDKKKTSKPAKKPISQAQIDDLIRQHKGRNAVECDCLKSCMNPKFSRYLFVGLQVHGEVCTRTLRTSPTR